MLRKLGIGFIALAAMSPGLAAALGVGEYELNSYLNEPLDMTVELQDLGICPGSKFWLSWGPRSSSTPPAWNAPTSSTA